MRGEPGVVTMAQAVLPRAGGARGHTPAARVRGSPMLLEGRRKALLRWALPRLPAPGATRGSACNPAWRPEVTTPAPKPGALPARSGQTARRPLGVCMVLLLPALSFPYPPQSHSSLSPGGPLISFSLGPVDQLLCCQWFVSTHRRRLPLLCACGPRNAHLIACGRVPLGLPRTHLQLAVPCPSIVHLSDGVATLPIVLDASRSLLNPSPGILQPHSSYPHSDLVKRPSPVGW